MTNTRNADLASSPSPEPATTSDANVEAGMHRPVAPAWLVGMVVLTALAAGLGLNRWITQRGITTVTGRLEAERVLLRSEALGDVVTCEVRIGDAVLPGDKLATIRAAASRGLAQIEASRSAVQHQRKEALAKFDFEVGLQTRELDGDIHALEMQLARLSGEHYAAEMERVAWKDALDKPAVQRVAFATPNATGVVTPLFGDTQAFQDSTDKTARFNAIIRHERAAATAESCQSQIDLCRSRLEKLKGQREQLADQFRNTLGIDQLDQKLAALEKEIENVGSVTGLASPAHGVVVQTVAAGDSCGKGDVLFELADFARRRISAAIPPHLAAGLEVGDELVLAFPTGDSCKGRVSFVAPEANGAANVPVSIEPAGKRWPQLPLGSEVTVICR